MILAIFGVVLGVLMLIKKSSRPWAIGGILCELVGFVYPPLMFVGGALELIGLYMFVFK